MQEVINNTLKHSCKNKKAQKTKLKQQLQHHASIYRSDLIIFSINVINININLLVNRTLYKV